MMLIAALIGVLSVWLGSHHQLLLGNGRVRDDGACSDCSVFCRVEREERR
jgi:hypothetical protein